MRLLVIAGALLMSWQVFAQRTHIESTVHLSEFKGKKKSGSAWCFLSSSSSSTWNSQDDVSSDEEAGRIVQDLKRQGRTVLARRINWDTSVKDSTFKIDFYADGSSFQAEREYDHKVCSYKVWKAKTSHTETILKSDATIKLPQNSWLVRVRFPVFKDQGRTDITLSNWGYKIEDGTQKLALFPLKRFDSKPGTAYFLVNPSTTSVNNAIEVSVKHVNNTVAADKFQMELSVDPIGQSDCLSELGTRSYKDILWDSLSTTNDADLEKSLVGLGCMMTPHYLTHLFKNMFITSTNTFFDELDRFSDYVLASENKNSFKYQSLMLNLVRKIRFYYSYEMAKDILILMQSNRDENGLSTLQSVELLRNQGSKQLLEIAKVLKERLVDLTSRDGFVIELSKRDQLDLKVLVMLLNSELDFIKGYQSNLIRPRLLSTQYYDDLQKSVEELEKIARSLDEATSLVINGKATRIFLKNFEGISTAYINGIENYSLAWESFRGNFFSGQTGEEIVRSHREFYAEFRKVFQINGIGLHDYFKTNEAYFAENFEAEEIKALSVNGMTFERAEDFITYFNSMMGEL